MEYYINKEVNLNFEDAESKIREELLKVGFGVLTEIDVKATLKSKINVDFRNYKILGACNPKFAYEALLEEDKLGVLLPCSIIVQEHFNGKVEVSIMNPSPLIKQLNNEKLNNASIQIEKLLNQALDNC